MLGRTASFPLPVRKAAMLGQRHALATLARDHGALDRIRHWPGRHYLHCEIRGLNDHDLLRVVERDILGHRLMILEMPDAVATVHVPPPPLGRPVTATPSGSVLTPQQQQDAAVVAMGSMDKVLAALQRSGKHMGPALGKAFAQLFTADNLKILAAFIIAGAIANTNPVSAAVFDSAMLIMVYYQAGSAGIDALGLLISTTMAVLGAKGEADLDRAGQGYAKAFVGLGGAVFMAWLARRIIREKDTGGLRAQGGRDGSASPARSVAEPPPRSQSQSSRSSPRATDDRPPAATFTAKTLPPGKPFDGTVYRLEDPARTGTTFDAHAGNIAADHRYSGPGKGAVYGSTSRETALAEVEHYGVADGRVSVSKDVSLKNVLDLTDPATRRQLGVTLEQINGNSYAVTQKIGDLARTSGYDGILAPSARNVGGSNLVIFPGGH